MPALTIRLFGFPSVERAGQPVHVARRKALALLAYLAATHQPHSREHLAALLWPDLPPAQALAMVRHALSALTRALGPGWLATAEHRVALADSSDLWIDLLHFRTRLADVAAHAHLPGTLCESCLAALTEAVQLAGGEFLAGFSLHRAAEFELWQAAETARVQQELGSALARLVNTHARTGRVAYEVALGYARRWVELDPLHEPARRMLMRLYCWSGDRTRALQEYADCERLLAAELGIAPESATATLAAQIRSGTLTEPESEGEEARGGLPSQPLLRHGTVAHNLPLPADRFVGRARELAQAAQLLADPECRLLTVVGPGGIGKTRLALQAARCGLYQFPHGVTFVDLSSTLPGQLLHALLHSLTVPQAGTGGSQCRLLEHLAGRTSLLVLDGFEHLLDDAGLLVELLHAAPRLKLLVTSRVRLNLREEWLLPLEGLALPPALEDEEEAAETAGQANNAPVDLAAYDATQLYLACVHRVLPDFRPTWQEAHAIAHICRMVGGMPLAIELAAGWARALSPTEIRHELARNVHLLHSALRDMPARHRSMVAVFDQSWMLLTPRAQGLLRQLSVFRGGCTAAGALAVAGAGLDELVALVDTSWLQLWPPGRYHLHEMVRQYCAEKLEQEHLAQAGELPDQVRDRHYRYYADFMHSMVNNMLQREVLSQALAESGNIRTAWRWALGHGSVEACVDMWSTLNFTAEMVGRYRLTIEMWETDMADLARQLTPGHPRRQIAAVTLAWIWYGESQFWCLLGLLEQGRQAVRNLFGVLQYLPPGPELTELRLLAQLGAARLWQFEGKWRLVCRLCRRLRSALQTPGIVFSIFGPALAPKFWIAFTYFLQARATYALGNYPETQALAEQMHAVHQTIGGQRYGPRDLVAMAGPALALGELTQAEVWVRRGIQLGQVIGDQIWLASAHVLLGRVLAARGQASLARQEYQFGLAVGRHSGEITLLVNSLLGLGWLALDAGDHAKAKLCFEEALDAFTHLGTAYALWLPSVALGLGWTALAENDLIEAEQWFDQIFTLRRAAWETLDALAGLGKMHLCRGQIDEAATLFGYVVHHPATIYTTRRRVEALLQTPASDTLAESGRAATAQDVAAILGRPLSLTGPRDGCLA